MENFKSILKNPTFHRVGLIAIIVIILLMLFDSNKQIKINQRIHEQNEKALKDSTIKWKTKWNTEYSENYVLLQTTDSLSDWSQRLQNQVDSLKLARPDTEVIFAQEADVSITGLTGDSTNTQMTYNDGKGKFSWFFDKQEQGLSRYLSGETDYSVEVSGDNVVIFPGKTYITRDDYNIEIFMLTTMNDDKSISVIATSPNENVSIDQVKSVIDPLVVEKFVDKYIPRENKDVEINWGIQAGIGVNPFPGQENTTGPIFYLGLGVQYELGNILEFDFKDLSPF
jgi:hypothetical protein